MVVVVVVVVVLAVTVTVADGRVVVVGAVINFLVRYIILL